MLYQSPRQTTHINAQKVECILTWIHTTVLIYKYIYECDFYPYFLATPTEKRPTDSYKKAESVLEQPRLHIYQSLWERRHLYNLFEAAITLWDFINVLREWRNITRMPKHSPTTPLNVFSPSPRPSPRQTDTCITSITLSYRDTEDQQYLSLHKNIVFASNDVSLCCSDRQIPQ